MYTKFQLFTTNKTRNTTKKLNPSHTFFQISEGLLDQLSSEVLAVMREADRPEMKEVKGLEERLCGLEQLMHEAKSVVQEQFNFSQVGCFF